jgi:hypothetical protein
MLPSTVYVPYRKMPKTRFASPGVSFRASGSASASDA